MYCTPQRKLKRLTNIIFLSNNNLKFQPMKKIKVISGYLKGSILWCAYSYERHLWVTANGTTFKDIEVELY